ncbi:MAG: methyl-accepting chemotaxis protein [Treponema sp.]|jgi:hypothetical protein|nr:methyl-accepting chemotaxis protein [Treponema sp.]
MAVKTTSRQTFDIEGIIREIDQRDIKVIVYFFSIDWEKYNPQKALKKAFPLALCVGASMIGGWSTKMSVTTGITVMSLSSAEVEDVFVSFHEGVKHDPVKAARAAISELKSKTNRHALNPNDYLGLIFFDGLCLGEVIMKEFSMEKSLNLPFIGGAAADELNFTKTMVGVNDRLSGDGLVAVILKMRIPFFFNHYVHYLPSDTVFTVTKSEIAKRIVWEIEGKPAADYYAHAAGVPDAAGLNAEIFTQNPLGVKIGDSIYVRSPNAVIEGGGLGFYCYIEAGTRVCLLRRGDIIADARNALRNAGAFLPGIQGILLFNCVLRYLELKETHKTDAFNSVFGAYPFIGFNTYGEELFTHHNQTLTAVFFGTPSVSEEADPYKTKRLFHYVDSKLRSLIFEIISRSELLNVTISYLHQSFEPISDHMKQSAGSFNKSTVELLSSFTRNYGDIESIDSGFRLITKEFGDSFSLTETLRETARKVSENLSAINNVTEITNVLGINAAIEAARAGSSGKGFTVVASEIRKHALTTKNAVETISKNIIVLINTINELSKKMDSIKTEADQAKQTVDNLVETNKHEISLINSVNENISTLDTSFKKYEGIKETLDRMIHQSNISKEDIEKMLIVYQDNVRKTGQT